METTKLFPLVTYKTVKLANVVDSWTRGLVVNRVGRPSDLSRDKIEEFMGQTLGSMPVISEIPESDTVQQAEREGVPITVYDPENPASESIYELAKIITGESDLPYEPYEKTETDETVERLARALTRRKSG
ncbi:MAG: MinD/ParA family ATP-binding protein [Candidatus Hadarchaeota archaeon]